MPENAAALPELTRVDWSSIPEWSPLGIGKALEAFRLSASEILESGSGFRRAAQFGGNREHWLPVAKTALTATEPEAFFHNHFVAFRVADRTRPEGLFTGYFEPVVRGSRKPGSAHPVPVYCKPDDLVAFTPEEEAETGLRYGIREGGKIKPYLVRRDIEQGALAGRGLEICWLNDWVEAFFMHIQGNGRVQLEDGSVLRLSYAAKSGHPYTGVGAVLADRGIMTRETMSMQSVTAWMRAHPQEARELMWLNKSYVFFRETEVANDKLGAIGAAKVHLTPGHSMAVDRSLWMFGTPFWIDTHYPPEAAPADPSICRLMIAQDTGSAIKGAVRGDFFWGWGEQAANVAGHMKSPGRMTALLPKDVAVGLGLLR